ALVAMVVPWISMSMGTGDERRGTGGDVAALAPRPSSLVPSVSSARNIPTAGSSGVVATLRTSIAPSGVSATRSVNVPPTSTPTLTAAPSPTPHQRGTRKAERGTDRVELGHGHEVR